MNEDKVAGAIATAQEETGLPCTDPIRFGAEVLLDAILDRETT